MKCSVLASLVAAAVDSDAVDAFVARGCSRPPPAGSRVGSACRGLQCRVWPWRRDAGPLRSALRDTLVPHVGAEESGACSLRVQPVLLLSVIVGADISLAATCHVHAHIGRVPPT